MEESTRAVGDRAEAENVLQRINEFVSSRGGVAQEAGVAVPSSFRGSSVVNHT